MKEGKIQTFSVDGQNVSLESLGRYQTVIDVIKDKIREAEEQARREEAVTNQVRRETDWLGRKESAQRSKSASRIKEAAERRVAAANEQIGVERAAWVLKNVRSELLGS